MAKGIRIGVFIANDARIEPILAGSTRIEQWFAGPFRIRGLFAKTIRIARREELFRRSSILRTGRACNKKAGRGINLPAL